MSRLFEQNRIAIVWDFDKTLIPRYMQVPLFERYDIAEQGFWDEVGAGSKHIESHGQKVNHETFYLNVLLRHVRDGRMGGLDNATLRRLGAELEFFPGVADFFARSKAWVAGNPAYQAFDIKLEHYIVSTGLTEMIKGSPIAPHIDGVWGCEFLEVPDAGGCPVISEVIYAIDNTTKTRALFEINKGVNKHPEAVSVNASIAEEERRVPFANMIYVADGPSDIPAFSVARKGGSRTYAVYNPDSPRSFEQADNLRADDRVDMLGPADYRVGSPTEMWLKLHIGKIADAIVHGKQEILRETTRGIPQHFVEPKRAVP
ncbi:HAD family hydrolase [Ralstonia solanacearum]|uniref:HAD family hydrolase n=1 Tax=Ralstonia solanacearum TaxID=305 RepID=UPI003CC63EBE